MYVSDLRVWMSRLQRSRLSRDSTTRETLSDADQLEPNLYNHLPHRISNNFQTTPLASLNKHSTCVPPDKLNQ